MLISVQRPKPSSSLITDKVYLLNNGAPKYAKKFNPNLL